jgi:hypothetical protein
MARLIETWPGQLRRDNEREPRDMSCAKSAETTGRCTRFTETASAQLRRDTKVLVRAKLTVTTVGKLDVCRQFKCEGARSTAN